MTKHTGRMTNERRRLTSRQKRLDQSNRLFIFGEIPQRSMSTGIKHSVKLLLRHTIEPFSGRELRFCNGVRLKSPSRVRLKRRLIALWIQRRLTSFRRRQSDLRTRVFKRVVRGSKLFEPKAGLASGAAQLIM